MDRTWKIDRVENGSKDRIEDDSINEEIEREDGRVLEHGLNCGDAKRKKAADS